MKESYAESSLALDVPESCLVLRKGGAEALIEVHAGPVLTRERISKVSIPPRDAEVASLYVVDLRNAKKFQSFFFSIWPKHVFLLCNKFVNPYLFSPCA